MAASGRSSCRAQEIEDNASEGNRCPQAWSVISGRETSKRVPPFAAGAQLICPPINSTILRHNERPRPRPGRPAVLPPLTPASKIRALSAAGTPIPVSRTSSMSVRSSPGRASSNTRPLSVNFMALPKRLSSNCRKRVHAPANRPEGPDERSNSNFSPFTPASGVWAVMTRSSRLTPLNLHRTGIIRSDTPVALLHFAVHQELHLLRRLFDGIQPSFLFRWQSR